ncbi:MAG: 1-deoxy-D-xylulose-5-phosphate reductoisomerase [Clostridia bacterium]|nr:1-deoxy-D-xylulose-5-phosphate reductoisomerase [Clostridia bacterium]
MYNNLSILGSTGSIGTQALDVARLLGLNIKALTANSNVGRLEEQMREFKPEFVAVTDENAAKDLKVRTADLGIEIDTGMDGLCRAAAWDSADMTLNSVVGMVGLTPTLAAIEAKKEIALANKETLVAGGSIVTAAAKKNGVNILPVDSEHSAIFQCLQAMHDKKTLKRLILTASGGPFFGKKIDQLRNVTREQALNHPTWSMGGKITIDSATMMNKGLEIIEAAWLFDMKPEDIDVVIHRESIVHSLIEFCDNSVLAQMGLPDMRIPIQYAITYPMRYPSPVGQLDLAKCVALSFYTPDYETFKCMSVCKEAIRKGGLFPAAANGANEKAVELFLAGKIGFTDIGDLVEAAANAQSRTQGELTLSQILDADKAAREFVETHIK